MKKPSGFHLPITQPITENQNQLLEIVFSAFSFDDPSGLIISQLTFCQIQLFRTKKVFFMFNFVNSSFTSPCYRDYVWSSAIENGKK